MIRLKMKTMSGSGTTAKRAAREKKIMGLVFAFLLSLVVLLPITGKSEPYLAARAKYKCGQCHVNRSGGGMRTPYGFVYSLTRLAAAHIRTDKSTLFDPNLNENIRLGANFRYSRIFGFGAEDAAGVKSNPPDFFATPEANLYLQMQLIEDRLSLYLDQRVAEGAFTRELFLLWEGLPANSFFKAGRTLLPYGLRLLDDESFVRKETGFHYNRKDLALEIGLEPGQFSWIGSLSEENFSTVAYYLWKRLRTGASFARNTKTSGDYTWGFFGTMVAARFTLLGEIDFIDRGGIKKRAYFSELDLLLSKGVNLKAAYDLFDRNIHVPLERDGQERVTIGLETFLIQFFQVGLFYRFNSFIPQNTSGNQDQAEVQLHIFF